MTIEYRIASENDLERIIEMKRAMFLDEDFRASELRDDFAELVLVDYVAIFRAARVRHFLATENKSIVACAGAFIKSDAPSKYFRNDCYGYIGDVFTEPSHRNRGLAKILSSFAVDWLHSQGMTSIHLKASNAGKRIYESLGFIMSDYHMLLEREKPL